MFNASHALLIVFRVERLHECSLCGCATLLAHISRLFATGQRSYIVLRCTTLYYIVLHSTTNVETTGVAIVA